VSVINSTSKQITANTLGRATHVGSDKWVLTSVASTGSTGLMSSADKSKLDNIPANGSLSAAKVIFVDSVNGNNLTAEIGNAAKPYATFAAGYSAGRATSANFIIQFAAGVYTYTPDPGESDFLYCIAMRGVSDGLTTVNIVASRPDVENNTGYSGYNIVDVKVDDLTLTINVNGGNVSESDSSSYTCGSGGIIRLSGKATIYSIDSNGGSEISSTVTSIYPGDGGSVELEGLNCQNMTISLAPGNASGLTALPGVLVADACDLRGVNNNTATITLGRCSYTSSSLTITDDKGGNASY